MPAATASWLGEGEEVIGDLIARLRMRLGKSQYGLADALRQEAHRESGSPDRVLVHRWETGQRIPTPYSRRLLAAVLGVPVGVLDRAAAAARAQRAAQRAPAGAAPAGGSVGNVAVMWDDLMRRRVFLYSSGVAALGALIPPYPAVPVPPDAAGALGACADLTAGYRRLEGILGPGAVYAQVAGHQRFLASWLTQARGQAVRPQLAALTADASILLAWLAFDLDKPDRAALLYRQCFDLARDLQDADLAAFLAGRLSRTLSEAGRHHDALDFARAAAHIAGDRALPQLRSWLAVTRAYVHACLGDERSCRTDLDTAAGLLAAAAQQTPAYLAFYSAPYQHKWASHALLALAARHGPAASAQGGAEADRALASWSPADVRESGEVLVAAARARLAQHEIGEAARLATQAHTIAETTSSPRITRYLTGLWQQLQPWQHTPEVTELRERMQQGH